MKKLRYSMGKLKTRTVAQSSPHRAGPHTTHIIRRTWYVTNSTARNKFMVNPMVLNAFKRSKKYFHNADRYRLGLQLSRHHLLQERLASRICPSHPL